MRDISNVKDCTDCNKLLAVIFPMAMNTRSACRSFPIRWTTAARYVQRKKFGVCLFDDIATLPKIGCIASP